MRLYAVAGLSRASRAGEATRLTHTGAHVADLSVPQLIEGALDEMGCDVERFLKVCDELLDHPDDGDAHVKVKHMLRKVRARAAVAHTALTRSPLCSCSRSMTLRHFLP